MATVAHATLLQRALDDPAPTHRHVKTGGLYRVLLRNVKLQIKPNDGIADMSDMVLYVGADGTVWVRPADEFNDGRFAALDQITRGK